MTEINPPLHMQNRSDHSAQGDRLLLRSLFRFGGVGSSTDLAVSAQASPNMTVQVAAGSCFVPGTENAHQGVYHCYNDAAKNVTITSSDPSLPRIDLIVARIRDQFYSGATNAWALEAVTGTPNASPSAPAVPANSIALAQVAVGAGVSSITNANLTSVRVPVRVPFSKFMMIGTGDTFQWFNQAGSLLAELDATGHMKSFGTTGGATKSRRPMVKAEIFSTGVPNLTTWKVPYTAGDLAFDTDGMFSDANDWIVINTAGYYTIRTSFAFAYTNTTGYRACGIVRNNSAEIVRDGHDARTSNGLSSNVACEITLACNPGDTFYTRLWQNSGASLASAYAITGYNNANYLHARWEAPLS